MKFIADLELAQGRAERAVRLAAAARKFLAQLGGEVAESLSGVGDPVEEAREHLPPEVHTRAAAEGRAMTLERAMHEVLLDPTELNPTEADAADQAGH